MSAAASPAPVLEIDLRVANVVREGLGGRPKRLPAWLFYDCAGSKLFEAITRLPEYYLTRTERGIFLGASQQILERASNGRRLRIAELGAGSAEKTRLLLKAAVERQGTVLYEPVDVSVSALDSAKRRIEREIPAVAVAPRVMDYTDGDDRKFHLGAMDGTRVALCSTSDRALEILSRTRQHGYCAACAPVWRRATRCFSESIW